MIDDEFQEIVRRGEGTIRALRDAATARGVPSLLEDGIDKVLAGETSLDEVLYAVGHIQGA